MKIHSIVKSFCKVLLLISMFAAALPASANIWSDKAKITNLYPYPNGLIFMTSYSNNEVSSCDGGTRFSISAEHENYDVLVSVLIAAYHSNTPVRFNIDEQEKKCQPTINRFYTVNG